MIIVRVLDSVSVDTGLFDDVVFIGAPGIHSAKRIDSTTTTALGHVHINDQDFDSKHFQLVFKNKYAAANNGQELRNLSTFFLGTGWYQMSDTGELAVPDGYRFKVDQVTMDQWNAGDTLTIECTAEYAIFITHEYIPVIDAGDGIDSDSDGNAISPGKTTTLDDNDGGNEVFRDITIKSNDGSDLINPKIGPITVTVNGKAVTVVPDLSKSKPSPEIKVSVGSNGTVRTSDPNIIAPVTGITSVPSVTMPGANAVSMPPVSASVGNAGGFNLSDSAKTIAPAISPITGSMKKTDLWSAYYRWDEGLTLTINSNQRDFTDHLTAIVKRDDGLRKTYKCHRLADYRARSDINDGADATGFWEGDHKYTVTAKNDNGSPSDKYTFWLPSFWTMFEYETNSPDIELFSSNESDSYGQAWRFHLYILNMDRSVAFDNGVTIVSSNDARWEKGFSSKVTINNTNHKIIKVCAVPGGTRKWYNKKSYPVCKHSFDTSNYNNLISYMSECNRDSSIIMDEDNSIYITTTFINTQSASKISFNTSDCAIADGVYPLFLGDQGIGEYVPTVAIDDTTFDYSKFKMYYPPVQYIPNFGSNNDAFPSFTGAGTEQYPLTPPKSLYMPKTVKFIQDSIYYGTFRGCHLKGKLPDEVMSPNLQRIRNYYMDHYAADLKWYPNIKPITAGKEFAAPSLYSIGDEFYNNKYDQTEGGGSDAGDIVIIKPATEAKYAKLTTVGDNYRAQEYALCHFPDNTTYTMYEGSINTIGSNYRYQQFGETAPNTTAHNINGPTTIKSDGLTNVTKIGDHAYAMFANGCSALTKVWDENLGNCKTLGASYMEYAFQQTGIVVAQKFFLPTPLTALPANYKHAQYDKCAKLTTPAEEAEFDHITSIAGSALQAQYNDCESIYGVTNNIVLHPIKASITPPASFRSHQFGNAAKRPSVFWVGGKPAVAGKDGLPADFYTLVGAK